MNGISFLSHPILQVAILLLGIWHVMISMNTMLFRACTSSWKVVTIHKVRVSSGVGSVVIIRRTIGETLLCTELESEITALSIVVAC